MEEENAAWGKKIGQMVLFIVVTGTARKENRPS